MFARKVTPSVTRQGHSGYRGFRRRHFGKRRFAWHAIAPKRSIADRPRVTQNCAVLPPEISGASDGLRSAMLIAANRLDPTVNRVSHNDNYVIYW